MKQLCISFLSLSHFRFQFLMVLFYSFFQEFQPSNYPDSKGGIPERNSSSTKVTIFYFPFNQNNNLFFIFFAFIQLFPVFLSEKSDFFIRY